MERTVGAAGGGSELKEVVVAHTACRVFQLRILIDDHRTEVRVQSRYHRTRLVNNHLDFCQFVYASPIQRSRTHAVGICLHFHALNLSLNRCQHGAHHLVAEHNTHRVLAHRQTAHQQEIAVGRRVEHARVHGERLLRLRLEHLRSITDSTPTSSTKSSRMRSLWSRRHSCCTDVTSSV